MKQIKILSMSVLIMLLVVTGISSEVQADNTDTTQGQKITSAKIRDVSVQDNIDPTEFLATMSDLVLELGFADGQTLEMDRWQLAYSLQWDGGDEYTNVSRGYLANPHYDYCAYLYDSNGNQVFLDYDKVITGDKFVLKFYRGYTQDNLVLEQEISIKEPKTGGEIIDNTAEFSSQDPESFETIWYPIPKDIKLNTEYKISRIDFTEDEMGNSQVSIWKYENGQATRVAEGLQIYNKQTFSYTFTDTTNLYLVIGEKDKAQNISGIVSLKEKRTLASIKIDDYEGFMWRDEQYAFPITVSYTDGTSEVYDNWIWARELLNANGDGEEVDVEGLKMTTPNEDELFLGFKDDRGNWIDIGDNGLWSSGTYRAFAYLGDDRDICSEADFISKEPETKKLDLKSYTPEEFSVTSENANYFTMKVDEEDEDKRIVIINSSPEKMYYRTYWRPSGSDEPWDRAEQERELEDYQTISFLKSGREYLIIVYTDTENVGTVGLYERGTVVSADVDVDEIDLTDLDVWKTLPITVNFVSKNDNSIHTGWQMICNWEPSTYQVKGNTIYAETIYYVLYKDGEEYRIPNENTIDKLRCGDYEIKVYKKSVNDSNLIGSKKVKTNLEHKWNDLGVTKAATCSEEGIRELWCTSCRQVKEETIPKLSHDYNSSYTIDKKATVTADGSKSKHCKNCDAKTSVTKIYKASGIKLSTATYTYDGKTKSPKLTIKDSKGKTIGSSNYKITTPSGRKSVGKYTYKVAFKNEYSGSKSLTLTINPKKTSISKLSKAKKAFTVKWKKQSSQVTGYQIQYSTSKKFTKAKTTTITKYKTTSKKITKLSAKKTYYVRIRTYKTVKVNGKSTKLYSGWSNVKSVKTK